MQTNPATIGRNGQLDAAAPPLGAVAGVFVAIGLARSLPLAGLLLAVVFLLLLLGIPRKR